MAAPAKKQRSDYFLDPEEVRRIIKETNERMGFVPDPTATPEKAQAMMRALSRSTE